MQLLERTSYILSKYFALRQCCVQNLFPFSSCSLDCTAHSFNSSYTGQAMGRQATKPTEEAVRRALNKEGWVNNTPSIQGVVGGWVAPRDAPTSSESLIRSISEQSWRGLAVWDFGGGEGQR